MNTELMQEIKDMLGAGDNRGRIVQRIRTYHSSFGLKEAVEMIKSVEAELKQSVEIDFAAIKSVRQWSGYYGRRGSLRVTFKDGTKREIENKFVIQQISDHISDLRLYDASPMNGESVWYLVPGEPKKLSEAQSRLLADIVESQWIAEIDSKENRGFDVNPYPAVHKKATVAKLAAYGYVALLGVSDVVGYVKRIVATDRAIEAYSKVKTFEQFSAELAEQRSAKDDRDSAALLRKIKAGNCIEKAIKEAGAFNPDVSVTIEPASYGSGLDVIVMMGDETVLIDSMRRIRVNYNLRTRNNGDIENISHAIIALQVVGAITSIWDEL